MIRNLALNAEEIKEASAIAAKAFYEEPLACYTFPDNKSREYRLTEHFEPIIDYYKNRFDTCYRNKGLFNGISAWEPPIDRQSNALSLTEDLMLIRLEHVMGKEAYTRYIKIISWVDTLRKIEMPYPHWHLALLAVHPSAQGLGIGRELVETQFCQIDAQNLETYLWTDQPSSINFYKHLRFNIVSHTIEPFSGIHVWTMKRSLP